MKKTNNKKKPYQNSCATAGIMQSAKIEKSVCNAPTHG